MTKDFKKWSEVYNYFFDMSETLNKNGYATLRADVYCAIKELSESDFNVSAYKIMKKLGGTHTKNITGAIKDLITWGFIDEKKNILK